jgi:magnesium transporter
VTCASWADLLDPTVEELDAVLPDDIHELAIERLAAVAAHDDEPRPRIEVQGEYLFGVLVVPRVGESHERVVFQELDLIVSRTQLVTVRKTPLGSEPFDIASVHESRGEHETPGMCLYALVDEVAERFLSMIDIFDDGIDELEDHVEDWEALRLRERISELRHDILRLRRVLTPTRDMARQVLDDRVDLPGPNELFPRDVEIHFADAYDKLLRATDGLDLSRDLLAGVRDYHQAQVANDQNEVMKRLTVIASILLLPTFIVGLYGQNFRHIPELGWAQGYGFSWAMIVLSTIAQLIFFRRKRWI